jgi:putative hydroxymethylpyrimidine transport system permease protein
VTTAPGTPGLAPSMPPDGKTPPAGRKNPRAGSGRSTRAWRRAVPPALVLLLVAAVWDLVVHLGHVQDYIFPSIENVFRSLFKNWSGVLASATWVTSQEMLYGFMISIALAVLISLALHSSATLRGAIYPLLIGSQTIPIVVIGPILAIIFGYGISPKLIIVAISCFFPIVVNLVDGLSSVDPDLIKVMRTLDGGRLATLFRVEFPSALPSFFSGMRIAAVYAPIGAVFGEYAGSQNGLGYVLIQATPQLNTDLVFAAVLLLTVMSILLFVILSVLEKICCPWAGKGKK